MNKSAIFMNIRNHEYNSTDHLLSHQLSAITGRRAHPPKQGGELAAVYCYLGVSITISTTFSGEPMMEELADHVQSQAFP
jgi:hypothetical protein